MRIETFTIRACKTHGVVLKDAETCGQKYVDMRGNIIVCEQADDLIVADITDIRSVVNNALFGSDTVMESAQKGEELFDV